MNHRLTDEKIDEHIGRVSYAIPEISLVHTNIVIIELLARLLEKDKPACKCTSVPVEDTLPTTIIEALDLAEKLLKYPEAEMLNGHARQDNLIRFGNLSQRIRNELANREREKKT